MQRIAAILAVLLFWTLPAFAGDGESYCWQIRDNDLRALCQGNVWQIRNPELRALARGDCYLIKSHDLRNLCKARNAAAQQVEE